MVSHCMETICPFHGYIHVLFIPSVDRYLGCCHFLIAVVVVTQSCLTLCDHMDCSLPGSSVHGDSPGRNTGVDSHSLLQGIFPNQRLNPGLLPCRWVFCCLSRQEAPLYSSVEPSDTFYFHCPCSCSHVAI